MDVLNLWNDDPEEVLLDLGFGREPDLSGRIPARFINYPSQARGINLQVFLEAQQNRLDLENPDVSNRFRQLEVLQQVTTAFSALIGSSPPIRAPQEDLPLEARERRRRLSTLFRRASKKTLSDLKNRKSQDQTASTTQSPSCTAPQSNPPRTGLGDNRIPFKRVKTGLLETMPLSPLAEEQGAGSDAQPQPQMVSSLAQDGDLRSWPLREGRPVKTNPFSQKRKSRGQTRESFEMEEIYSFDEGSVTGGFTGGAESLVRCVVRTNSCQSDSSGFQEEPFVPPQSQQESPDLIKALSCLSGGSTESHNNDRPGSPSPASPDTSLPLLQPSTPTPPSLNDSSVSSTCPQQDQSSDFVFFPSPALSCLPKSDLDVLENETPPVQDWSPSAELECLSRCSSPPETQNSNDRSSTPPAPPVSSRSPMETDSLFKESEEIKTGDRDSPPPELSACSQDSDPTACTTFSSGPLSASSTHPELDFAPSPIISSFWDPGDTQSEHFKDSSCENSHSASDGPSSQLPSFSFAPSPALSDFYTQSQENHQDNHLHQDSRQPPPSLLSQLERDRPLALPALIQDSSRIWEFSPEQALSCLSGGSTESHNNDRPGSPSPASPDTSLPLLQPSTLTPPFFDDLPVFSTCPQQDQSSDFVFFPSPALPCVPKSDTDVLENETPMVQDWSPSASAELECLSCCSSPPETQNSNDRSSTPPAPPVSSCSPMETDSLFKESEEIKTGDRDSPSPELSACSQDSDSAACTNFSSGPLSASSTHPELDCVSSPKISSFGDLGDTQSEHFKDSSFENSHSASDGPSSQLPSFSFSPSPARSDFYTQGHENHQDNPLLQDSGQPFPSLLSQLERDKPLASPALIQDSLRTGEFTPEPNLSLNPSTPICESTVPLETHNQDSLMDTTAGEVLDVTKQSTSQQDRPTSDDENTSADQEVFPPDMDHFSLDLEENLQKNGKGDRHLDYVQTPEAVYTPDPESSSSLLEGSSITNEEVCKQEETDPPISREECQMEIFFGSESEARRAVLVPHEAAEADSRQEVQPKGLFEIESLDVVFQTSVDGSDGENGDCDAFLEQLDTERQVYWAEPIHISSQCSVVEESGSFEASGGSPEESLLHGGPVVLDSLSPMSRVDSAPANADLKPSNRSVSVQMSSSPSSHIIHRKDIPYMTDSKPTHFPSDLSLDTSSPFRAVQSWTDWQIQKNNCSKMLSHGALDVVQNQAFMSTDFAETTQKPPLVFSSSPCLPLLKDWRSYDGLPGTAEDNSAASVSVNKGLWSDQEEEEVERNRSEDEKNLWEDKQTAPFVCCCSCDHQDICFYNKQHSMGNIPYSLDELEEMMLCLQQFRSVLCNMEEQLSEDQAAVYSCLSDQDREKVRDIEELRRAVKKEAEELEMQLNELAHHYDDGLKMKMHRLLDEQSLLCSQLRVSLPGKVSTSLGPAPNRTVATQCSLLPWMKSDYVSHWSADSPRQSPPGSDSISEGPTKADKVDLVSFLQRLKESLQHSVNTDSLE
ncbi:uncharacterized protein itprid1 [Xyrichtys novacula]|nr:uncharacterized protein itprid1 [Xyrichtys novacula]